MIASPRLVRMTQKATLGQRLVLKQTVLPRSTIKPAAVVGLPLSFHQIHNARR